MLPFLSPFGISCHMHDGDRLAHRPVMAETASRLQNQPHPFTKRLLIPRGTMVKITSALWLLNTPCTTLCCPAPE